MYSRVATQIHETISEESKWDINEDFSDLLDDFEVGVVVEHNVGKSSHGPI